MALTGQVDSLAPKWTWGAAVKHWLALYRCVALFLDIIIEAIWQGKKAAFPNAVSVPGVPLYGGFEDTIALQKYLAPDAGCLAGLTESPPQLAQRIRHAQGVDGWPAAGTVRGLFAQIAGVLSGPDGVPKFAIVDRQSQWWVRNQDGTVDWYTFSGQGLHYDADWNPATATPNTTHAQAWSWDYASIPAPPTQDENGDFWLIIWEPVDTPYGTTTDLTFQDPGQCADLWSSPIGDPSFGAAGAPPNAWGGTIGTNSPYCLVELVRAVVGSRETSGFNCLWIIVSTRSDQFLPDGSSTLPAGALGTAYPVDGTWGYHTKYDAGTNSMIVARNSTAEYWLGPRYPGQVT